MACRLDAYYLGWSPSTFYRVYSVQVVVLMAVRWIVYRFKLWHYYLLDFCYFGGALSMPVKDGPWIYTRGKGCTESGKIYHKR